MDNSFVLLQELRSFIEYEADLLDTRQFGKWLDLYTEDCIYWVPAKHGQEDAKNYVSLFFDDKHIMKTRVARLQHPQIHVQDPPSQTVRVVSNFRVDTEHSDGHSYAVTSKFIMLEDRPRSPRRHYGGVYSHTLLRTEAGLRIVRKKVELTNCDQSFSALAHPF